MTKSIGRTRSLIFGSIKPRVVLFLLGAWALSAQPVCEDSNNGFGLLVNWNNLGSGEHAIRALIDGVEFARTTVRVTTLGVEFLKGVQRTVVVPDFPHPDNTTTLQWEESLQNFVIIP